MSKNAPAFPVPADNIGPNGELCQVRELGLTKREYFAGLAMQSILLAAQTCEQSNHSLRRLADENKINPSEQIGKMACEQADMLLAALEKGQH